MVDIQIGFRLPQYDYLESNGRTFIGNLTIIRGESRQSEQSFAVSISFGDPGAGIRPATLQEFDAQETAFDYVISVPGVDRINRIFQPFETEINAGFILFGDELPEGIESIRARC